MNFIISSCLHIVNFAIVIVNIVLIIILFKVCIIVVLLHIIICFALIFVVFIIIVDFIFDFCCYGFVCSDGPSLSKLIIWVLI